MERILITGGAGFIPSSLANGLLDNIDCEVILVDNMLTGDHKNIPKGLSCKFYTVDVNDFTEIQKIFLNYKFDYVFHYAAVVGVKRTIENPIMVLRDVDGIKNILELSVKNKVKKVFFSSSSEVYGEPVELPMHEKTTPLNSRLPYAIVKNIGEAYFKSYNKEFGLFFSIFRFFNTYGVNQSKDFVISKFLNSAIYNQDITIYGDGKQNRTFCYIDDNIDVTLKILKNDLINNQIINIGNEIIYTINDLAKIIVEILDSKSKIINVPALPEGDMTRRQPDISKMKNILKRPLIDLREGLLKILNEKQ
tara:strand:- start:1342 stop:2262 length:921 start_codon:yes stop_codon:yes gene_type:complete